MADWDAAGLPDFVLREGYQEGFSDTVQRSQMDTGPQKRRRRFTADAEPNTYPVELTSAELDIFRTFYDTTLGGGALSFTKTHPRTSVVETYAFTKAPDPVTPSGYNNYILILPLELLP